jgi:hypothetical protein
MGLGIFFLWSPLQKERFYIGLMCFFFAFIAAGIFRIVGMALYGFEDPSQPIVSGVETVIPLYGYYLAIQVKKART